MNAPQTLSRWSQPGSSRVPFWAYTDAGLYQRELEKIFYGQHWSMSAWRRKSRTPVTSS
jgi:salicylate 5-hydroxylase large subunit